MRFKNDHWVAQLVFLTIVFLICKFYYDSTSEYGNHIESLNSRVTDLERQQLHSGTLLLNHIKLHKLKEQLQQDKLYEAHHHH